MLKIYKKEIAFAADMPMMLKEKITRAVEEIGYPFTIKTEEMVLEVIETEQDIGDAFMNVILNPKVRLIDFIYLGLSKTKKSDYMVYDHPKVVFTYTGLSKLTNEQIREYCRQKDYPVYSDFKGGDLAAELMKWKNLAVELYTACEKEHDLVLTDEDKLFDPYNPDVKSEKEALIAKLKTKKSPVGRPKKKGKKKKKSKRKKSKRS